MSLHPRIDKLERNKIINGNFNVWQRGESFTGADISFNYTADRWQYQETTSVGACTVTKSTDTPAGYSGYSYNTEATTGYGALAVNDLSRVRTILEGADVAGLRNKEYTISFHIKAAVAGTFVVTNGASANGSVGSFVHNKLITINAANTWEKKTIIIPALEFAWANDNGRGLELNFTFAAGTNFDSSTTDVWSPAGGGVNIGHSSMTNFLSSTNNYVRLFNVMLNEGSEAGEFNTAGANVAEELVMCQRYYEKIIGLRAASADQSVSTSQGYAYFDLKVDKRLASYTIIMGASIANGSRYYGPSGLRGFSSVVASQSFISSVRILYTISGTVVTQYTGGSYVIILTGAEDYIAADAEL